MEKSNRARFRGTVRALRGQGETQDPKDKGKRMVLQVIGGKQPRLFIRFLQINCQMEALLIGL